MFCILLFLDGRDLSASWYGGRGKLSVATTIESVASLVTEWVDRGGRCSPPKVHRRFPDRRIRDSSLRHSPGEVSANCSDCSPS